MRFGASLSALALSVLLLSSSVRAEVKVTVERNEGEKATPDFKFKEVPSPAAANAATSAKFTLVDGDKDGNSGDMDVLHDGKLPGTEDEPSTNFFFADDSEGGRIGIDLGKVIDIKSVDTYSWHPNTRAAQVYTLYASDGTAKDFNAAPGKDVDPEKCGWKMITKVDTRPKTGDAGGQYGVSVYDTDGTLGKYRYLLLAVSRTESDDSFGNTFYSEISVVETPPVAPPVGDKKLVAADAKTVKVDAKATGNGKA
jgi:hypothetical protein